MNRTAPEPDGGNTVDADSFAVIDPEDPNAASQSAIDSRAAALLLG